MQERYGISDGPGTGTVIVVSALTSALIAVVTVLGIQKFALFAGIESERYAEQPSVSVPELVTLKQGAASEVLKTRSLRLVVDTSKPDTAPAGTILEQRPQAGSKLKADGEVRVVVSSGSPAVPDVRGKSLTEARTLLRKAGLKVGSVGHTDKGTPGTVAATSPAVGAPIQPGATVALVVSEQMVEVPSILGRSWRRGRRVLKEAGLKVGRVREAYDEDRGPLVVLRQEPRPNQKVRAGSRVDVLVNQGD